MLSRINLPGEIYFVTTNTFCRQKIFNNDRGCQLFIKVLADCRNQYKFRLYGYVIMLDHIHLLIMPPQGNNISDVMRHIKGRFARTYNQIAADKFRRYADGNNKSNGNNPPRRRGIHPRRVIWQKSFYDHIIRNDLDFEEKLNYIHSNPIKHSLIKNLDKYPWSSYQNYYLNNDKIIKIDYLDA